MVHIKRKVHNGRLNCYALFQLTLTGTMNSGQYENLYSLALESKLDY